MTPRPNETIWDILAECADLPENHPDRIYASELVEAVAPDLDLDEESE